ncbi:uncharacterized protein TRAVEDRAFT_25065 [Trametes versicolor FP-101664 SS1]|uniref:Uncharacterized protein n=1 Tax=Trametes versicolor (strain FP-101664) TaxID=717944 RepID=R7S949_TRAVS|nr:uncharacterized protein TRAVEDRAFT_25065 [Trametes versicolor FP-101664 SS1]EIW51494.1 hypothetical protein TRAVEDRAFT_25065 [Trametes versicolor FP-101664 SS1]
MPEYREAIANAYAISRWLDHLKDDTGKLLLYLRLRRLWADATDSEQEAAQEELDRVPMALRHTRVQLGRAALGNMYMLGHDSQIKRGSKGAQEYVWPRIGTQPLSSFAGVHLNRAYATPQTVVLELGTLRLQVRLHTHTVTQVYTREQWHNTIKKVSTSIRKFRVGLALDFNTYIVAFLSPDNLCITFTERSSLQPYWTPQADPLPVWHPDIFSENHAFLNQMADWVMREAKNGFTSENLAINVIRKRVGGVGIYTSEELMFMSGLSAFLTVGEFLCCPSRVARFCEAFWTLVDEAHSSELRRYAFWLYVHGKSEVLVPLRLKEQWIEYQNVDKLLNAPSDGAFWTAFQALIRDKHRTVPVAADDLKDVFEVRMNPPHVLPSVFDPMTHAVNRAFAQSLPPRTKDTSANLCFSRAFTVEEIDDVKAHIRTHCKGSARGDDGIGYDDVLALDSENLRSLFQACIDSGDAPAAWVTAIIAAIKKPGKDGSLPEAMRTPRTDVRHRTPARRSSSALKS